MFELHTRRDNGSIKNWVKQYLNFQLGYDVQFLVAGLGSFAQYTHTQGWMSCQYNTMNMELEEAQKSRLEKNMLEVICKLACKETSVIPLLYCTLV